MSRSNPQQTNPAKRFFDWSGGKGILQYYDKEKQERVEVKLPFEFLVLDELATVTGYCDQDQSRYWSNEVRSVARDELIVKTSKGIKEAGLYKNLADVRSKGAKYAKSIYIAFKDGDEYVIGNIKAYGAALTAWIEFSGTCNPQNGKVLLTGSQEAKKGATTYYVPTFSYMSASSDENEIAIDLDKELQVYLTKYLTAAHSEPPEATQPLKDAGLIEDIDEDEPIDLSDIPF
jgi:hypothetical protein